MKIVKGDTVEKQIKHIDVILDRFSRRLHKNTIGIIPPHPISNCVSLLPTDGVVLRYMFPIDGSIILGALHIDNMPKSGVDVYTVAHVGDSPKSETFFTKKQLTIVKPDISVSAGTRLVVSVRVKDGEQVSGVWVSLLWVPEIKGTVIKQFLIDELERKGLESVNEGI